MWNELPAPQPYPVAVGPRACGLLPLCTGPTGQEVNQHPVLQFLKVCPSEIYFDLKTSPEGASNFSIPNRGSLNQEAAEHMSDLLPAMRQGLDAHVLLDLCRQPRPLSSQSPL